MDTITSLACEAEAFRFLTTIVAAGELRPGSLLVACTDADGHPGTIVAVDEVPADPPQHSRVRALGQLLELIAAAATSVGCSRCHGSANAGSMAATWPGTTRSLRRLEVPGSAAMAPTW